MTSSITYHSAIPERWLNIEALHTAQLLPELQQPTIIKHPSKNPTENPRWLITLQHANESSGLYAFVDIWKKLHQQQIELNHDLYFAIVNGYGATRRAEYPMFGRRFAPDQIDWNRCWTKPGEAGRTDMPTLQKEQVTELTQIIIQSQPQYVIDIHNTTGKNKPLAFVQERYAHNTLTHNLVEHIIYSGPLPGSLLDRFSDVCETITIECGKTGTLDSYIACEKMIQTIIQHKTTNTNTTDSTKSPKFYQELGRMVIAETIDFSFYDAAKRRDIERGKFFVRSDIENLNQTAAAEFGSVGMYEGDEFPLRFLEHGIDKTAQYLQMNGNKLEIIKPAYGLLFTTNAHNIRVTELGYLMERVG